MVHSEGEVVGEARGSVVSEEALAKTFGFPTGDHTATTGRNGHGTGPTEDLQLNGGTLHAGYAWKKEINDKSFITRFETKFHHRIILTASLSSSFWSTVLKFTPLWLQKISKSFNQNKKVTKYSTK